MIIICDITFKSGYIAINQRPVGTHLSSNLVALAVLSIYIFFNEKLKIK